MQYILVAFFAVYMCLGAWAYSPAQSPVESLAISPVIHVESSQTSESTTTYLHDLSGINVNFELDTTFDDSVSGSTWDSVTTDPWDGSDQAIYSMSAISNVDGFPALTGTGNDRHFLFDGDSMFLVSEGVSFYSSNHKSTGEDYWYAVTGEIGADNCACVMVGTQNDSGSLGTSFNFSSLDTIRVNQEGDTGTVTTDSIEFYSTGYRFLAIYTHDHGTNTDRFWMNGTLTELSSTYNATTTDATAPLHIGGHGTLNLSGPTFSSSTEVQLVAGGQGFLSVSDELAIRQLLESRHGEDYTENAVTQTVDFLDTTGEATDTVLLSSVIRPGIAYEQSISVSISGNGGEYRFCSASDCTNGTQWYDDLQNIDGSLWLQARQTSSASDGTQTTTTVNFASGSTVDWAVTTAVSADRCDSLGTVVASTNFDVDATCTDSYGGTGQTWANLEATPSDGETQSTYDVWLGSTSSGDSQDPTFTGTADTTGAYFSMDGSDYFTVSNATTTTNNMHKTTGGTAWWVAVAGLFCKDSGNFSEIFGTSTGTQGILARGSFAGSFDTRVSVDRGSRQNNDLATGKFNNCTDDYIMIISGDPSSTDDLRVWLNTTTAVEDTDMGTNTSTTNANGAMHLGGSAAASACTTTCWGSGTRIRTYAHGDEYLDNTKAALIFTHLETRHGLDYTP